MAAACIKGRSVPLLWASTRWYLRRARDGYLRENAAWGELAAGLTETVEGARTVEALRLAQRRIARADADITGSWRAERYTLWLRCVWFPLVETGYVVPVVATVAVGGVYYRYGLASLAQVTAATLYVQQLVDPLDRLVSWVDELQVGGASLARLLGVAAAREDRTGAGSPADQVDCVDPPLLSDAVDSADPLFEPHGIPWKFQIDDETTGVLQVQPLSRRVGCDQQLGGTGTKRRQPLAPESMVR